SQCKNSEHYKRLLWCLEPMIEYEESSVQEALKGNYFPLCELVEKGSIITYEEGFSEMCSTNLTAALSKTSERLRKLDFLSGPEALVARYFGGLYFSFFQAVQLDTLLEYASELNK